MNSASTFDDSAINHFPVRFWTEFVIGANLRFLPRMNVPISYAFLPQGFHLVAALIMGTTAGFCEEVLFRAFLMTEFANAGYRKVAQVLIPGVALGLSHAGYLNQGFLPWLGIAIPTAFLGMMWGVAYLLGRRSLVPAIVAHFSGMSSVPRSGTRTSAARPKSCARGGSA